MNFLHKFAFSLVLVGCSAQPQTSRLNILGGKPANVVTNGAETKTFTSTVQIAFEDNSTCTATKIGARHFLTAAHCLLGVDADTWITVKSHKTGNSIPLKISSSSFVSPFDNREANYDSSRTLIRDKGQDWAVIVVYYDNQIMSSLGMSKELDNNIDLRKIGNPNDLKPNDVVLAAGWGIHEIAQDSLIKCPSNEDCAEVQVSEREGAFDSRVLRRAFFRISDIARNNSTGNSYLFEAAGLLKEVPFETMTEGFFSSGKMFVPGMLETDDLGLTMKGDSGGPVILEKDGEQFLVGVIKGQAAFSSSPSEIREIFSSFDKDIVEKVLEIPVIDVTSEYARPGRSIIVAGYLPSKMEVKALTSNESLQLDTSCSNLNPNDRGELDNNPDYDKNSYSCWNVPADLEPQFIEIFINGEATGKKIEVVADGKCTAEKLENSGHDVTDYIEYSFIGPEVWAFLNPEEGAFTERTYSFVPNMEWIESFDKVSLEVQETGGLECYKYLEDASCVPAPATYNFEISAGTEAFTLQTPSWQHFTNYRFDITNGFKDWYGVQEEISASNQFKVIIRATDGTVYEGLRAKIVIHSCDLNQQP